MLFYSSSPQKTTTHKIAESNAARLAQQKNYEIQSRLDAVCLINQALFELVSEKLGITEGDVLNRAEEIDRRDGVSDGKMSGMATHCPQCGRTGNTSRINCIYCGCRLDTGHLFQKTR